MIERVVKSALGKVGKALDPDELVESNPLNFQLYYADRDGRAEMINTVYLEDGNPKLDLYLEVFNESSGSIDFTSHATSSASRLSTVEAGGTSSASAEKCHFSIRWEKDLKIKPSEIEVEQAGQWQVNYDEDSHFFTLYFLSKQPFVLESKNPDNDSDRILLKFKNFTANNRDVKTSNVEFLYGSPLLLNSEGEGFTELISCKNAISVTNHPDDKNIPLQFRFIGPNTILNDGTTQNSLKLQIINRPSSNNTRPNLLLDKANSKFIVDFEIGSGAEALIPSTQANKIKIATSNSDWKVPLTQNGTAVTVDLKPDSKKDKLVSGEAIELEITGIVTGNPSGVSFLYITYQNIGNYPDGRLVVPVEKTPLLYRGTNGLQVGIGTNSPEAKLHVKGGDALIGGKLTSTGDATIDGKVGIGISSPNEKLEVSGNIKATGAIQPGAGNAENKGIMFPKDPGGGGGDAAWIRYYARSGEACTLEIGISDNADDHIALMPSSGSVGIGTNAPSAKLDVSGGDAIVSGKVGIGTTTPSDKLHVDGNIRLSGNINGANQKLSIYSNTTAGNSNAWIELWGKASPDSNRTGELSLTGKYIEFRYNSTDSTDGSVGMRLNNEGRLGIGTTTPSAKLHVQDGDAIVSGKLAIRTTNPTIDLAIGDNDTGLKQQGDGKLAIYTDNVERVRIGNNGNVGIGTTDPKQKLHVQGRIRLSDVPVWDGGGGYDLTWVAHGYDGANENDSRWNCIAREGSSERYKQNIAPLEDDFQKLLSLQPKQYQMKEGYGDPNTWEFGYLAEDLDKIGLKSLVIYNQSGQPDGIQYKKMCIYLNEVVKSQQSSMERLEEKVNELNEKLMSSL